MKKILCVIIGIVLLTAGCSGSVKENHNADEATAFETMENEQCENVTEFDKYVQEERINKHLDEMYEKFFADFKGIIADMDNDGIKENWYMIPGITSGINSCYIVGYENDIREYTAHIAGALLYDLNSDMQVVGTQNSGKVIEIYDLVIEDGCAELILVED